MPSLVFMHWLHEPWYEWKNAEHNNELSVHKGGHFSWASAPLERSLFTATNFSNMNLCKK